MLRNVTQESRLLTVESPLGKNKLILTGLNGSEYISKLFHFQLDFFSADPNIKPEQLVGHPISFSIQDKSKIKRNFHGIVNVFSIGPYKLREGRNYRAEVVPWLWFLTRARDCCIFQNKSVKEILIEVFKKFNFNNYSVADIKGASQLRLYCVQYQETAFDFLSRLMEEEGIFYYFRFEKNKHILVLSDSESTHKDIASQDFVFSSGSLINSTISRWERVYYYTTGSWSKSYFDFEKPSNQLTSEADSQIKLQDITHYKNYEYGGTKPDNIAQKDGIIKKQIQAEDKNYLLIQGQSSSSQFSAGGRFKMNSEELKSENGRYTLVQVSHHAFDHTHQSQETLGQGYENTFECIPANINFAPQRNTIKPRMLGMQTAIVVGPSGEEIFTDKYGRVKVQFHWDREGKNDDKSSCWIRIAQTWSGNKWGTLFIPRIGQEVVVTFLDGDPDQPLIVGSVYNAEHMPPYDLPANNTQSAIKSHSSKNGSASEANELRFEDKKGEELFYLHAQKDFHREVEHDDKLEIKNDQSIIIHKNRSLAIEEGDETYTVKQGDRSLIIEKGNNTLKVKNNYQITVESGNQAIEIQQGNQTTKLSQGKCSIEAMTAIELKVGQNSIKIDQSGITIQGIKVSASGTMVEVKADASLKLQGTISEINSSAMLKMQGGIIMIN